MNKMKIALIGAMMMLSGAVIAQDYTAKYNQAAGLIGEKKYAEAIPLIEQVIEEGIADGAMELVNSSQALLPDLYYRKGLQGAQTKAFDQAIADLSKADELAELYNQEAIRSRIAAPLAKVYEIQGGEAFNAKDFTKAIEIFSAAYAKYPTNTAMALNLAKSYAESGDMTKAAEIYKNIMALESTHSKYAEPAAKAKEELTQYMLVAASQAGGEGNLDGVMSATDVILSYDPTNAIANLLRLQVANNAKNYDTVISCGESAAEAQVDPEKKSEAYFLLGQAYENKGNKAKAIELYKKVTAGPNAAQAKQQATALAQ